MNSITIEKILEENESKIKELKLSEIKFRLEAIKEKLKSNDETVIDILIELSKKAELLKKEADERLGSLENI